MKYTKKVIQNLFNQFVVLTKQTDWQLDYIACYGGYVIEHIDKEGGVSHPFGTQRRSSREMALSLMMAIEAVKLRYIIHEYR